MPRLRRFTVSAIVAGLGFGWGLALGLCLLAPRAAGTALPTDAAELHRGAAPHAGRTAETANPPASEAGMGNPARPFLTTDIVGGSPNAERLHWEQRARHLERQLPFRAFLQSQDLTLEELEERLQCSWVVDDVNSLQTALGGVAAEAVLDAWRIESSFRDDLRPWLNGAPARDAPFAERIWYHENVLCPEALTGLERTCIRFGDLGLPVELIERFRKKITAEYH